MLKVSGCVITNHPNNNIEKHSTDLIDRNEELDVKLGDCAYPYDEVENDSESEPFDYMKYRAECIRTADIVANIGEYAINFINAVVATRPINERFALVSRRIAVEPEFIKKMVMEMPTYRPLCRFTDVLWVPKFRELIEAQCAFDKYGINKLAAYVANLTPVDNPERRLEILNPAILTPARYVKATGPPYSNTLIAICDAIAMHDIGVKVVKSNNPKIKLADIPRVTYSVRQASNGGAAIPIAISSSSAANSARATNAVNEAARGIAESVSAAVATSAAKAESRIALYFKQQKIPVDTSGVSDTILELATVTFSTSEITAVGGVQGITAEVYLDRASRVLKNITFDKMVSLIKFMNDMVKFANDSTSHKVDGEVVSVVHRDILPKLMNTIFSMLLYDLTPLNSIITDITFLQYYVHEENTYMFYSYLISWAITKWDQSNGNAISKTVKECPV